MDSTSSAPGGAFPCGDEQRVRGIRTGYAPAPSDTSPRRGGLRAGIAPDGDRGLSGVLLAALGQPGEPLPPAPGQRPCRFGSAKFSVLGVVRRIDASKFDPAAVAVAAAAEGRRQQQLQQEQEAADAAASAAAALDGSDSAARPRRGSGSATGLRTGIDPHAAARAQAAFAYLRHAAPARDDGDGDDAVADPATAPAPSRLGGRKFAARGFLRRLWREDPEEVADRAAGERRRQEAADARAVDRRARLASCANGEGYDVITLADVGGSGGGGGGSGDAAGSGSGGGARSRSAPPRAGGLRYLRSGVESADAGQGPHTHVERVAAARLRDSPLRYYYAGCEDGCSSASGASTSAAARAAVLAREGLTERTVATLRRSSVLGLGRLDLPSAGAADALGGADYGGAPAPTAAEAAAATTRRVTAWSPEERTAEALAAAGAVATAAVAARRAARSQHAPNRVFDASQSPALLPAVAGVTRYATPEDEVVAATAAARKLAAARAAAAGGSCGGGSDGTRRPSATDGTATTHRRSGSAAAAAAARQRDIDAVRALVL